MTTDNEYEHFYACMNAYQSCWTACGSCNGCGMGDDDIFESCDCDGKCDDCNCKKVDKPNSEKVQDDGCFCRGRCGLFQPFTEPDGDDGKCLCYGCKNGY